MKMKIIMPGWLASLLLCFLPVSFLFAQYPPQAPLPGHVGIPKDSPDIIAWASGCTVERGWMNIADTSLGKVSSGTDASPLGIPDEQALSLGDGGVALLTFEQPIENGEGPDFAVFENAFVNPQDGSEAYLELAFVEVSSDGEHFVRFPAVSGTQDSVQNDNFTYMDASLLHNLAGKYANGYGTPFDLEELKNESGLDVNNIRYVKVIDVVGSLDSNYAGFDKNGRIINDPFPSPYPTGGFDLTAIAVLNQGSSNIADLNPDSLQIRLYPNPAQRQVRLQIEGDAESPLQYRITDLQGRNRQTGRLQHKLDINCATWPAGIYLIRLSGPGFSKTVELIKL